MLVYKLLPKIEHYIIKYEEDNFFYEQNFTDQLGSAVSESLDIFVCVLKKKNYKEHNYNNILTTLKNNPEFVDNVNRSYKIIRMLSSIEVMNVLSINNIVSLLVLVSIITALNFYVAEIQNIEVATEKVLFFEEKIFFIKDYIFNFKNNIAIPSFYESIYNRFITVFENLAKLEKALIESCNKIMREKFDFQYENFCIHDLMHSVEKTLKETYDSIIDFLVKQEETILSNISILISKINQYVLSLIYAIKAKVDMLIAQYSSSIAKQLSDQNNSHDMLDLDLEDYQESSCNVIAAWMASKVELWFYTKKSKEEEQDPYPSLTGNSLNDILKEAVENSPNRSRYSLSY